MSKMASKMIPDRWNSYNACGSVIEGTRIICFKVPLRKRVQKGNSDVKKIWDIDALLKNVPKLGFVIDLTNTTRYYDPKDLKAAGVLHKKIMIPGRILPPKNKVLEFFDVLDSCLGKNSESLIGVHCTHGLNRSGYMVCRYMRDILDIPPKEAISRFEKARGYRMERHNYIADLLHKIPPPPQFGRSKTDVKPINAHDSMNYVSPLSQYDDDLTNDIYIGRYGSRIDRKKKKTKDFKSNPGKSCTRDKEIYTNDYQDKSKRQLKNKRDYGSDNYSREKFSRNYEFDYRHDY